MRGGIVLAVALTLTAQAAFAQQSTFIVAPKSVADEKAVFATVESANVVPARARIGGTVVALAVKEGDGVTRGQVIATVGDEKLVLQMKSLDAQIAALEAQLAQAQTDFTRAEDLFSRGTVPKTTLDQARTALNVATNTLKARTAERSVIQQQVTEGNVLAPTSGRVLKVPVTTGTVILPGETIATIGGTEFRAAAARAGAPRPLSQGRRSVRIDGEELGKGGAQFGTITLVYPQIEDGRVVADATVADLGDYFVGERIRVWVSAGERAEHHRAGRVHRHPLRHRLCPRAQGRRKRSTCRCSAGANCRAPTCRTRWKSSPASNAATCWCGRESRTCPGGSPRRPSARR